MEAEQTTEDRRPSMAAPRQYQQISADGSARQQVGDSYNTTTNNFYTPGNARQSLSILHAAQDGNLDRLKYLVEQRGVDVETEDEHGLTALHCAAWAYSEDCIEYLLQKGAYIHHRSGVYGSPVTLAAFMASRYFPEWPLGKYNIKAKESALSGGLLGTPLHALFAGDAVRPARAPLAGPIPVVQALVDSGAPVDAVREVDLEFAALLAQDISLCRQYLSSPRNKRVVTGTPLNIAVRTCIAQAVEVLLGLGANVNAGEKYVWPTGIVEGVTPLMRAFQYNDDWRVVHYEQLMRDPKLRLLEQDSDGCDALMWAASNGCVGGLSEILNRRNVDSTARFDVNRQNPEGKTALILAAARGHESCIGYLIWHGARIELRDGQGKNAVDYAREIKDGKRARKIERILRGR